MFLNRFHIHGCDARLNTLLSTFFLFFFICVKKERRIMMIYRERMTLKNKHFIKADNVKTTTKKSIDDD